MSRRTADTRTLHGGRRPRVLLVDDHRQVLDRVAAVLSWDFDVVGVAEDGAHAVEKTGQLNPDAIVMDVEMPGLDGFQTLRALKRAGFPTPPVVFLSMHDADDVIGEAFRCGAHGYVLKQRIGRDLMTALDQALLGRKFVPSLGPLVSNGHSHAMLLYNGVDTFVDGLATAVDLAMRRGDAACVIATGAVRASLDDRLRALGWDVGGSTQPEPYLAVDVTDALNSVMRNGLPDPERVSAVTRELDEYRRAASRGAASRITVIGNLSGSLASVGNGPAALALEKLWSSLTGDLPFLTICGYPSSCFHDGAAGLWPGICGEHRALSHAKDV